MTNVDDNASALLGMFNQSDDRFSSGARRAWLTSQIADVGRILNINCGDDADWVMDKERGKEVLPLGILNPNVGGKFFHVKIEETTIPSEYQADNVETSAKRKGKDGDFITNNGDHIFSNTNVVLMPEGETPTHVLLTADVATVATVAQAVKDEVGL